MPFTFLVTDVSYIPATQLYIVEGTIESGAIKGGEVASVEGSAERQISIKSVGIAGGGQHDTEIISLSVEKPPFAIEELVGLRLISK